MIDSMEGWGETGAAMLVMVCTAAAEDGEERFEGVVDASSCLSITKLSFPI